MTKTTIGIIGTGNVAWHVTRIFSTRADLAVTVYARHPAVGFGEGVAEFPNVAIAPLTAVVDADHDIFMVAVADGAISEVGALLKNVAGLVAHTSGFTAMEVLPSQRRGVFYVFQSMTKGLPQDLTKAPLLLEASSVADLQLLEKLGTPHFNKRYVLDSAQRKYLHIAAVFANNFTNHMLHQAERICEANDLPFAELLQPLIAETFRKHQELGAQSAQTGPASRGDAVTVAGHLAHLKDTQHDLYAMISSSIAAIVEKENQ
ncbi:MAG: DUF2520 domain-containing protein [Schleiferiaceae bacterium]|nr:DUF2520 domain-containing protein [Schleiferiaceae bacterium]